MTDQDIFLLRIKWLQQQRGRRKVALGSTTRNVTVTQPWPPPPPRARTWPIAALALVALGLAAVSLVMSVTRSESASSTRYTDTQKNAAQAKLCERFKLADDAAGTETNGSDIALARISATNAAVILESAASDPALNDKYRSAALALASSYQTMTAEGSRGAEDMRFRDSVDAVNARTQILRDLCRD